MAIAVVLILLVVGSLLFHFLSPWWFTPIASNWGTMDDTVNLTFWVCGAVFVAVNLFMAWAIMRYRHRAGHRAKYEPESKKLEWWLTIVTAVGVVAMLTPGLFVWAQFVNVPKGAAEVEALGQQWNWSYRYPGADGQFGASSTSLTTPANPFGIDPKDPNGQDDILVTGPELHLPIGKPVKILLRSNDVLHNFTVPQFRVKMDLVPGMITHLWLEPTRTGTYDILCEELCGLAHFAMRGSVVVDEQSAFDSWLSAQATFAQASAIPAGDAAAGQAAYATCQACHGASGEGNELLNAPRLAGLDGWYIERQLHNFRSGLRGAHEQDTFGKQMVAFASMLDATATRNVIAYLATLPDARAARSSVAGDAESGRSLYTTCAGCHGIQGQGVWTTQAPRLAAMGDWYMVRQLKNFREGIRGAHPQDVRGRQMAFMARVPRDDRAIADLATYIHTLKPAESMVAANETP